jgi:hypothetical protein
MNANRQPGKLPRLAEARFLLPHSGNVKNVLWINYHILKLDFYILAVCIRWE